jgi:hypothetical protein
VEEECDEGTSEEEEEKSDGETVRNPRVSATNKLNRAQRNKLARRKAEEQSIEAKRTEKKFLKSINTAPEISTLMRRAENSKKSLASTPLKLAKELFKARQAAHKQLASAAKTLQNKSVAANEALQIARRTAQGEEAARILAMEAAAEALTAADQAADLLLKEKANAAARRVRVKEEKKKATAAARRVRATEEETKRSAAARRAATSAVEENHVATAALAAAAAETRFLGLLKARLARIR